MLVRRLLGQTVTREWEGLCSGVPCRVRWWSADGQAGIKFSLDDRQPRFGTEPMPEVRHGDRTARREALRVRLACVFAGAAGRYIGTEAYLVRLSGSTDSDEQRRSVDDRDGGPSPRGRGPTWSTSLPPVAAAAAHILPAALLPPTRRCRPAPLPPLRRRRKLADAADAAAYAAPPAPPLYAAAAAALPPFAACRRCPPTPTRRRVQSAVAMDRRPAAREWSGPDGVEGV